MSGRKQHFIPQSLLRGFGSASKGAKIQVLVYSYERGTFIAATDGIAAEREFYSELDVEGTSDTLDDKITDYEQTFPGILDELRSLNDGQPASTDTAAEFVTHLVVRNDHFRKSVASGAGHLVQGITDTFTNEDEAKAILGLNREQPNEVFAAEIGKLWAQLGPFMEQRGMSEAQFGVWAFEQMKEQFPAFFAETVGPLKETFAGMAEKLPEVAATAQRRSLAKGLSPPKRVELMREFEWMVTHPRTPIILPDCVAVAVNASGEPYPLMLAERESMQTIYMPLSSDRLLIGSRGKTVQPSAPMNEALATCSWDFFVARERTDELELCRTQLRARVSQFLVHTVEEVIAEAKEE